jgi:hypothetical protein
MPSGRKSLVGLSINPSIYIHTQADSEPTLPSTCIVQQLNTLKEKSNDQQLVASTIAALQRELALLGRMLKYAQGQHES